MDPNKLWETLKEMGIADHLTDQEVMEPDMEQWTGSKLGKDYVKAEYCYPAYLTYMQSTS